MKHEVLKPFLEKALAQWAEVEAVEADGDGDYVFRRGSAEFFVRLTKDDPPVLKLWSVLLKKVKPSPRVFRVLNSVNSVLSFARIYAKDDLVILSMEMSTDSMDGAAVAWACDVVGMLADDLDTRLKDELGGKTAHPDEPEDEADAVKV
ncbi:MAG: T3SS (YopN, CesT) and YbjN peptide-binding chaperone 1 [Bacteroidales bacterium]